MAAALARHLPNSTRIPSFGGTSFWVQGPRALDSEVLARAALEQGIIIEPGRIDFGGAAPPRNFMRLAFSSIEEKKIEPGIQKLAALIPAAMRHQAA
jgi:GntR family transcriptional regulator/MocR family aminotransferase